MSDSNSVMVRYSARELRIFQGHYLSAVAVM